MNCGRVGGKDEAVGVSDLQRPVDHGAQPRSHRLQVDVILDHAGGNHLGFGAVEVQEQGGSEVLDEGDDGVQARLA